MTILWSTGEVLCRLFPNCDLSDVFLIIRLELGAFRRKTREVNAISSHHLKGTCCQQDFTVVADLDHWGVCGVSSL